MSLRDILTRIVKLLDSLQAQADKLPLSAKGFLSIKHAAEYSDLSEESVRRLYKSGKLTALRPKRGKVLIDRKELEAYIRSCDGTPRSGRGLNRPE